MVAANRTHEVAEKIARVRVSGMFTAILGCMLGREWTDPRLASLILTSDGHLLGMAEGDIGYNHFLGSADDLNRNLRGVAKVAELTPAETRHLLALAPQRGRI